MTDSSASRQFPKILVATLLLLVLTFVLLIRTAYRPDTTRAAKVTLDQVYRYAQRGQIMRATLLDEDAEVVGQVCSVPATTAELGPSELGPPRRTCNGASSRFRTPYPRSDVATQQLIERISDTAPVVVDKQTGKAIMKLVATYVFPLLLLANLFALIFLSLGRDNAVADIAGFGKIGRNRQGKRAPAEKVTFAQVAGAEEVVTELQEVIDYLQDPKRFEAYGAAVPKGVLLFGPPGCGKTLLARAVAGESGVPFFATSGTEFVESLVGIGAARVRDLFSQVREVAPAIVFIDEIDAVGRRRGIDIGSGGEREQTLNQLLVEIDGFEPTAGIVLVGATNRPDILDPALLRPGRFDRQVTLDPPDIGGRRAILELHARKRPLATDVDFDALARRTPGFTGADLANLINEAALLALRERKGAAIEQSHLSEAVFRVLHGPRRRGRLMSAEERTRIAVHECGHAVVAASLGQASDVQRVSIIARGRGLGHSTTARGERVLLTGKDMKNQLAISMAGVAAEEFRFGDTSTMARDDLERANSLAREMVGLYGMGGDQLGRLLVLSKADSYIDGDEAVTQTVSGEILVAFDRRVKDLITEAETTASRVLAGNGSLLDAMVKHLEDAETLEGPGLTRVLDSVKPGGHDEPLPAGSRSGRARRSAT